MKIEIPQEVVTDFVKRVLEIQKRYAHELTGARTERRTELGELLNKIAAEKLEK